MSFSQLERRCRKMNRPKVSLCAVTLTVLFILAFIALCVAFFLTATCPTPIFP